MIKKLKTKAIILALVSLFVLLVAIVSGMTAINYNTLVKNADKVINDFILNNELPVMDEMEEFQHDDDKFPPENDDGDKKPKSEHHVVDKKDPPKNFRELSHFDYFVITVEGEGNISRETYGNMGDISDEDVMDYTEKVISQNDKKGFVYIYRFKVIESDNETQILCLDCAKEINGFFISLFSGLLVSLVAYIVVSIVLIFLVGKIIGPISESYEKQKRFITNAGHEMRTPITIINANTDVLEMELDEENEAIKDIKNQTKRLSDLTNDLVYLSRMEEQENDLPKIDFPLSDVVEEMVHSFHTLADEKGINIDAQITPMLTLKGDSKAIEKLVSILMSNAVKYSPKDATISVSLKKEGRQTVLKVSNPTECMVNRENLSYVFERFYRSDSSRNSQTGGHGIGLSVAKVIVASQGGKIKATTTDGKDFCITVIF